MGQPCSGVADIKSLGSVCRLRLQYAREEWGSEGQPDSKGGVIGGQLLMRVDLMGSMEEALSSSKALGEARWVVRLDWAPVTARARALQVQSVVRQANTLGSLQNSSLRGLSRG